jgi:hypothetical protein
MYVCSRACMHACMHITGHAHGKQATHPAAIAPASVLCCEHPVDSGMASCMQPWVTACRCSLHTQQEGGDAGHTHVKTTTTLKDSLGCEWSSTGSWHPSRLQHGVRLRMHMLSMAEPGPKQCVCAYQCGWLALVVAVGTRRGVLCLPADPARLLQVQYIKRPVLGCVTVQLLTQRLATQISGTHGAAAAGAETKQA